MENKEFEDKYIARFVADHLHPNGALNGKILTWEQTWTAFCMGDGFGERTPEELAEINSGYDWSHVRDSSIAALERIAEYIGKAGHWQWAADGLTIRQEALRLKAQLEQHNVPAELFLRGGN